MGDWYREVDDGASVEPCDSVNFKDRWRIATTTPDGSVVSTVFLALDHGWGGFGDRPVLYETLVQSGPLMDEMDRYHTRAEAIAGHAAMCARIKAKIGADAHAAALASAERAVVEAAELETLAEDRRDFLTDDEQYSSDAIDDDELRFDLFHAAESCWYAMHEARRSAVSALRALRTEEPPR